MSEMTPVIQNVLGSGFELEPRKSIGAAHSGHGVVFGRYNGVEVAAKPFTGERAMMKAAHEERMMGVVRDLGVKALVPLELVEGEGVVILLTHYERGLVGASALSIEAPIRSERGQQVAESMACVAVTLAEIHDNDTTHGDPQGKNFGFKPAEMAAKTVHKPWVFDLEKSAQHGKNSPYREAAMLRDWRGFTFTLGSRRFGGKDKLGARAHLIETVLEPYVETRLATGKCADNITKLIEYAMSNFERTRGRYQSLPLKTRQGRLKRA